MKTKQILALLVVCITLLAGCSKQEIPNDISNDFHSSTEISAPMQEPVENDGEKIPSTAYGINFNNENVSISNGDLIVSPKLTGGASDTHVGIMVFVDGVPQKYSVENSEAESYMSTFDIEANSEKTHNLKVGAKIDGNLDEHFISLITMLAPEYTPSPENPYFGFYHKILRPVSLFAPEGAEGVLPKADYQTLKSDNSVLTKKQLEKFGLDEGNGQGYAIGFYLLQSDNRLETSYTLPEGNQKIRLNFCAFTTLPVVEKFRVTFFVNHKQVNFNGDQEYLDVTMEGEKITETEIELENVNAGDFIYCIAVPLVAGESTFKSDSKMILSNSAEIPGNISTSSNSESQEPDIPTSSQGNEGSIKPNGEKVISFNSRTVPQFSIGESIYVIENGENVNLLKMNSDGEILKKFAPKLNLRIHGNKISSFENDTISSSGLGNGSISFGGSTNPSVSLVLLDADFNEVKRLKITDNIGTNYDFDDKRIVYVYKNDDGSEELRVCDWDLKNLKTLMILPGENDSHFNEIALADGYIAFRATDKAGNYYGVCDFDGKSEKHLKSNMSSGIQVIGDTALWFDKHVNVANGEVPSGGVVLYRNGKFEIIKTESPIESQDVFLTGENEFFTWLSNSDVLRQYKNSIMTAEIPLEKGESVYSIVRTGNKVFAGTVIFVETDVESEYKSEYQLKIWELS